MLGAINMQRNVQWLKENLVTMYDENPFINLLDISIGRVEEGRVELCMPVIAGKHTNLYNIAHGGAIASLADSAMGIACATTGKKVVTLEMNMNFIKGAAPQSAIRAIGQVIHNGKSTIVAESEIVDSQNQLLAKTRGTFFVVGMFEENKE
jgi:1,4-dihydroxy-2-naphthoyl-CoA hydrolase